MALKSFCTFGHKIFLTGAHVYFSEKSVVAAQMPQKSLKSVHCRKNFLKIFREKCTLDLKSALTTLFTPILDPDIKKCPECSLSPPPQYAGQLNTDDHH